MVAFWFSDEERNLSIGSVESQVLGHAADTRLRSAKERVACTHQHCPESNDDMPCRQCPCQVFAEMGCGVELGEGHGVGNGRREYAASSRWC
jgi:hypothetical protein